VHRPDFGFFGTGLLLPPTGSGVTFSLLQPDPDWILFLRNKRYWLFILKLESNRIRITCVSLLPDAERIWI